MAIETKEQLKTYFETGDIPTQNQFENLIDSMAHQSDLEALIPTSFNKFNKDDLLQGYLRTGDAFFQFDADSYISNYIEIEEDTDYFLSGRNLTVTYAVAFYDSQQNLLPDTVFSGNYEMPTPNGTFKSPIGAKFLRMAVIFNGVGDTDAIQLEVGTVQTPYQPYALSGDSYTKNEVDNLLNNISPEQTSFFNKDRNLFDKETMVFYDDLISNSDGSILAATGWAYMEVPVDATKGNILVDKGLANVGDNNDIIHFYNSNNVRVGGFSTLSGAIPTDAAYMRMNISENSNNWDVAQNTISVKYGVVNLPYVPFYQNETLKQEHLPLELEAVIGKSIMVVGDSIVLATGLKGWLSLLEDDLGVSTINRGDNGATITDIYPTVSTVSGALLTNNFNPNIDLVLFSAGVNDFANDLPLGTDTDRDSQNSATLKGSLYKAIKWVEDNHPTTKILVATPLEQSTDVNNGLSLKLKDYRDAIINVCDFYNIPYVDMMYNNLISMPTAYKYLYDGLHPNNEGYAASYEPIRKAVIEIFK